MIKASPTTVPLKLTLLLAAIFALSPLAIDTYLPAITSMAKDLAVDTEMVAITVSLYVFGMAFGQLIGGPLSDKKGRKLVIILGLATFSVASIAIALTTSIEFLWFWRVVQSIGGGIAAVCVPAIIRDNVEGKAAAKLFSLIALIMMVAPSVAPSIGSFILLISGWHAIFVFLCIFAISIAWLTYQTMPNTKISVSNQQVKQKKLSLLDILKHKQALKFLVAQALGYSVLMIFLANAPLIYMVQFKVSPTHFSTLFFINVAAIVIVNRLNAILLNRNEPAQLLKYFFSVQLIGGLILLASVLYYPTNLTLVVIGIVICVSTISGIVPNASACYLQYFKQSAGGASAILGFSQYSIGASISALTAILYNNSLWPVTIAIICCSSITLFAMLITNHKSV